MSLVRALLRAFTLVVLIAGGAAVAGQTPSSQPARGTAEQRTARYFESIRSRPPEQLAFLLRMPKGGDLHSHLSGAVYAESFIRWAAAGGLCINQTTWVLAQPPCDVEKGIPPVSNALTNGVLFRQMIDNWSMRNAAFAGRSGHDLFFDAFGKFGPAGTGHTADMLAEVVSRAAMGHVSYLEVMLTPDALAPAMGLAAGWDGNAEATLAKLQAAGIDRAVAQGRENVRLADAQLRTILKCDAPDRDPGCGVVVRYVYQVSRTSPLGAVFAQMVTGLTLANDPASKVVAINMVAPEDALASMQNFSVHMQMLKFLRPKFPAAHLTLHAGELAPGLVPPDGLRFHIRQSVEVAGAERIGHGVDVMSETNAIDLLKEMAARHVMVEVCLSSNDGILGVRGKDHPLLTYLKYGVPVALATDDEGVSRSEMSREYLKAAQDQGLGYLQLKTMARTSLEHAFVGGASLWADARKFVRARACATDTPQVDREPASASCRQFLAGSEKARLQWSLEAHFAAFEGKY